MQPTHYTKCEKGWQPIDVIEAYRLNFHQGNALKYVVRCESKGDKMQDLIKAQYYLQRSIENNTPQPFLSHEICDMFYHYVCVKNVFNVSERIGEIAYCVICDVEEALEMITNDMFYAKKNS
jgi:hypothetical protein